MVYHTWFSRIIIKKGRNIFILNRQLVFLSNFGEFTLSDIFHIMKKLLHKIHSFQNIIHESQRYNNHYSNCVFFSAHFTRSSGCLFERIWTQFWFGEKELWFVAPNFLHVLLWQCQCIKRTINYKQRCHAVYSFCLILLFLLLICSNYGSIIFICLFLFKQIEMCLICLIFYHSKKYMFNIQKII